MYLKQTAIANPHASFHFEGPHGEGITYQRSSKELLPPPVEIKPHPHGVELERCVRKHNL